MLELREGSNNVEIIGTVKKVELEEKVSKNGKGFITGEVIVEVKEPSLNRVNNIKVRLFQMKHKKDGSINGIFKGYKTVQEEWNPGDRCRINGSIDLNRYFNGQGKLVEFNEVKGLFCNRLEGEEANRHDKAIATVDMIIRGITSELDSDGIPTENLEVDAMTIGYGPKVIMLKNMIIGKELGQQFQQMYTPGTTGRITFKINNYAEVVKAEVPQENQLGFGVADRVEDNVVTDYHSSFEIIGGDLPYNDGVNEYTQEQIAEAERLDQLAIQTLKQENSAPATPTGFGAVQQTGANGAVNDLMNTFTGGGENDSPFADPNGIPAF